MGWEEPPEWDPGQQAAAAGLCAERGPGRKSALCPSSGWTPGWVCLECSAGRGGAPGPCAPDYRVRIPLFTDAAAWAELHALPSPPGQRVCQAGGLSHPIP